MLVLFLDFYIRTYVTKPTAAKEKITNCHKGDNNVEKNNISVDNRYNNGKIDTHVNSNGKTKAH